MEVYYEKTLEREPLEEKKSKPVDEDKPKSDISDKMLILEEEIESLQTIVVSKNEQVEELQSMLEKKDEIVKELESIQEQVKPLQTEIFDKTSQVEEIKMKELESLQEQLKSLQTTVVDKTSQTDDLQNAVENNEVHLEELQMQRERIRELEVTIQEMKQLEETRKTSSLVPQNSSDIISMPDGPDLHIAKQKVFHIKGNTLDWGDYGFKMYFPEGTIPPSQVLVKALVGGKFLFPYDVELVSALYVIQFPENFLQPLELEIQHCVTLTSLRQFKHLSFVIAPIDESVPPYKFQFIEGGKFYTDSQYGKIVRSKFSITGIVLKSNGDSVHTSFDEEEQSPSDPSSDTDSVDDESTGSTDSSSEDKNATSNTTQTTSGNSGLANIQSTETTYSLPPEAKNLTSDTSSEIQTSIEHEVREDISSDNQETLEEVKHKSIDDISTESSITSPDIQEKSDENFVKTNNDDIINTPVTQIQKQKKTSCINYGGKIFYESRGKNRWLMRFIAVKDLNALSKYVLAHHPQAEVDQSVSFKFSDDSYYLELIMDKKQDYTFNEWVIRPHTKPCKLSKVSMDKFGRSDSDGIPDPPSCLVSVYAKDQRKADELLSYAVSLKGVVSLTEEIFITRFLETTDTSRTVQQFRVPSNPTYTSRTVLKTEHVLTDTVSNTDDIEDREDISSDNQETHEEVKHKNIDHISTENIITSPDIQEEKSHENDVKTITNNDDIINTPDIQIQKQKKTSSINYGGKIFYESRGKNRWLMRFIAVKDPNALSKYVLAHHPQAEVDQSVSFKFSDDSYYLELIMDKKQDYTFNEWVIRPHTKPCKLSKVSMDKFGRSDSDGLPDPPSCLVSVYAKDQHKADELLSYAVSLKGVVSLTEEIFITRFLETTDTSRTVQQFSVPSNSTDTSRTVLKTELRKKEELITQIESENKQMVALRKGLLEKPNGIDVQEFQETKTYKDKEVQVNYLVYLTDRLSSVHVAAQKQFLIQGSKRQVFDWEQFGFKMQFPQGSLHQSETCEVAVKALVGGMFQFPQDTQLVSATYAISFADELLQPVTLEIQHCVLLKSKEQFKYLSFMIAQIDESAPPYKFQLVRGGKFNTDNQYGTITRQKFCLVGIGKKSSDDSSDDTSNEEGDPPSDDNTSSDNEQNPPNDQTNTTSDNETHTNDQTNTTSDNETHTNDQTTGSDSGSVHEDTDAVHYDIEHTDINDATLTPHTEQDNKVVFEAHQNDDESLSVGFDNDQIKMKNPYPPWDLVDKLVRKYQDSDSTNNEESYDETSFDNEGIDKDNDPSSDTDVETQTNHSISIGVQVPNDSGVPDNIYTGRIYYERIGSNKWLMMFMVLQKIKVFLEFISAEHPTAIEDQIIRCSFVDSKTGYIELLLQDSDICHGWYIEPHMEPLKLMKRDADLFGSSDLPIPPSCLITVWAKLSCDPEERFRHPVTLTGIDCNTRKIYISRFLETSTTESTLQTRYSQDSNTRQGAQGRDLPFILNKSPEVDDVYELLSKRSVRWNDFARALNIDLNFRETLVREGSTTTEECKLEKVLQKWMESKSSDVTWNNLVDVLEQLHFLDIASEVKCYLERKEVIEKYHKKKDYTDAELNDEIDEQEPVLQKDAVVQFDYWVPMEDLLHGAHIVDERVFNVQGDKEQYFNWIECGFRLYIPEGALLPTETCPVAVKAIIAGRFILPKRTELVSAFYAISASRKFRKEVKTELQHCLLLENEAQTKHLHFIKAHQTNPGLPYHFKLQPGGEFMVTSNTRYAALWQSEFSIEAIVKAQPHPNDESGSNNEASGNGSENATEEEGDQNQEEDQTTDEVTSKEWSDESQDISDDDESISSLVLVDNQEEDKNTDEVKDESHDRSNDDEHISSNGLLVNTSDSQEHPKGQDINQSIENQQVEPNTQLTINLESKNTQTKQITDFDNGLYRAHTFYEKVSRYEWIFMFAAIKHLNVHIKYIEESDALKHLEKAESFEFRFKEDPEGYICLNVSNTESLPNSWHVDPYSLPCGISKTSIDLLATQFQESPDSPVLHVYPVIPMCMVSIHADADTSLRLRYAVPVEGIVEMKTIFIMRSIAIEAPGATLQKQEKQEGAKGNSTEEPGTTNVIQADPHQVVECIKRVFDQNYSSLGSLFEDSIDIIASEMLQAGLISRHVAKKPTFQLLINDFTSGMVFMRKADEIINHFIKFLRVLLEMQGPFVFAAEHLKVCIINSRLGIELNLNV